MLSSSPNAHEAEMNSGAVEDLDFKGSSDSGGSPAERTEKILSAMTLEEKIGFIGGYKSLAIRALPRFGLPSVWMTDASSGPRCFGPTTAFPSAVAMAAAWDTDLTAASADHIAEMTRAKGVSILLGPGVNIARIPTCGRNFEYLGEDPYLAGVQATAYVKACAKRGVICTVKHMAVNNSEYDRHKISSDLDERTLREIYLPAFERTVTEGKTRAVMSSYNPVNGTWASENRLLLTDILRTEWGFDGMVVSDWNSLYSTSGPLKAGLDIEMPKAKWLSPKRIKAALAAGSVDETDLNRMVGNLLRTLFAAGVYDRPVKDPDSREFHPDHDAAALEAARSGIVLLKNDGAALPLPEGKGVTIAVCGPPEVQSAVLGGGSCNIVKTTGTVALPDGMKNIAAEGTAVITIPWNKGHLDEAARKILGEADAVVIACGYHYITESELYERPWILPKAQRRLIKEASALNPRTVVTLNTGGDVETESWISGVPALLHGFFLGQSVGTALAEVLFGRANPSGRLPFTMAKKWTDIAAVKNYPKRYWKTTLGRMIVGQGNPHWRRMRHWRYTEGLMIGYRHFDTAGIEPAFPFGHGLSYTEFKLDDLRLSRKKIGAEDALDVTVRVTNTGNRPGAEVVQIYIEDVESRLPRPKKELKGFAKVRLNPGESADVKIKLEPRAFRYWDPDAEGGGTWIFEPGEFRVLAGRSSRRIDLEKTISG